MFKIYRFRFHVGGTPFVDPFVIYVSCLSLIFVSVPCSLVVTCWETDNLLALLCVTFSCVQVLSLSHIVRWVRCGT